jgi:hypothetical protein
MLKFYAQAFVKAAVEIEVLQGDATTYANNHQEWRCRAFTSLTFLLQECRRIHLDSVAAQIERMIGHIGGRAPVAKDDSLMIAHCHLLREVSAAIEYELTSQLFLRVSSERQRWYSEDDTPLFGPEVRSAFSDSAYDIAEAGRCFALERWDASVHHLMIATEVAMRVWAKDMRLKTAVPLALSDMEAILRGADCKLKQLKNQRRSKRRDAALTYLSETSAHFGFIKDAWRKHSAHGRAKYDERAAKSILTHVADFMRLLSSKPELSGKP